MKDKGEGEVVDDSSSDLQFVLYMINLIERVRER